MHLKNYNQKKILITATIMQVLFWVVLIALCLTFFNLKPFPEKMFFSELDQAMIDNGEAVSLGILYFLGITTVLSFIANIVFASIVCYRILAVHYLNDDEINSSNKHYALALVKLILFVLLYSFIGILLIIYCWYLYTKNETGYFVFKMRKNMCQVSRAKAITFLTICCATPILAIGISGGVFVLTAPTTTGNNLMSADSVKKATKLSNNHQNVIQLYFDRASGIAWNMILTIDYLMNKETSFIYNFPEFTSYVNSLSPSKLTKVSNPVIYSGTLFAPFVKEWGTTNTFDSRPNKDLTLDDWYFNAFKNEAEGYMQQGVAHMSICGAPYFYDSYAFSVNASVGNMHKLQERFDEVGMNNVSTTTNAKICSVEDDYSVLLIDNPAKFDEHVTRNLPRYLDFENTNTGSFLQFFSQQCHEAYVWRDENDNVCSSSDQSCLFDAIYTAIKEIQNIFTRLKNEPFYDAQGNVSGNVYDHTLIYVISDHGHYLNRLSRYPSILNYLKSKNIINDTQKQALLDFDNYFYNPTVMIKPFKYDINEKIIHNQTKFDFNTDQIFYLGDLQRVNEIYLNEYHHWNLPSKFISKEMLDKINPVAFRERLSASILDNPLDPANNSIRQSKLANRQFLYANPSDWRYNGHDWFCF